MHLKCRPIKSAPSLSTFINEGTRAILTKQSVHKCAELIYLKLINMYLKSRRTEEAAVKMKTAHPVINIVKGVEI